MQRMLVCRAWRAAHCIHSATSCVCLHLQMVRKRVVCSLALDVCFEIFGDELREVLLFALLQHATRNMQRREVLQQRTDHCNPRCNRKQPRSNTQWQQVLFEKRHFKSFCLEVLTSFVLHTSSRSVLAARMHAGACASHTVCMCYSAPHRLAQATATVDWWYWYAPCSPCIACGEYSPSRHRRTPAVQAACSGDLCGRQ